MAASGDLLDMVAPTRGPKLVGKIGKIVLRNGVERHPKGLGRLWQAQLVRKVRARGLLHVSIQLPYSSLRGEPNVERGSIRILSRNRVPSLHSCPYTVLQHVSRYANSSPSRGTQPPRTSTAVWCEIQDRSSNLYHIRTRIPIVPVRIKTLKDPISCSLRGRNRRNMNEGTSTRHATCNSGQSTVFGAVAVNCTMIPCWANRGFLVQSAHQN